MVNSRKAFTLIEILVVIAITGVILTAAVAPIVLTVRNLRITEKDFGTREAMWKSLSFIARDLRQSLPGPSGPSLKLLHGERLGGGADDVVCFWSSLSISYGMPPGTVMYRIISEKNQLPGLYRVVFPSLEPSRIDCREMPEKDLQILIPYAESLRISVWDGEIWVDEYEGPRPAGVRFTLERRGEVVEYVDWIPR